MFKYSGSPRGDLGIKMKLEGVVAVAWAVAFLLALFGPAARGPAYQPSVLPPELTSGFADPTPPSAIIITQAPVTPAVISTLPMVEPAHGAHAVIDIPRVLLTDRKPATVTPPVTDEKGDDGIEVPVVPEDPDVPDEPAVPVVPDEPMAPPRLDVLFCLDTTGSMGDEIEVAKDTILVIADAIQAGTPAPEVRYGLVIYRDLGDIYVTKVFDFTNATGLAEILKDVRANNGGDTPESVSEALVRSVHDVTWDLGKVSRGIYLIGDAPPHLDYDNGFDYLAAAEDAASMGIVINAIGCSGIQGQEKEFKEVANITGGAFVYLTYGSGSTGSDPSPDTGGYDGDGGYGGGGGGGAGTGTGGVPDECSGTGEGTGCGSGSSGSGTGGSDGGSNGGSNDLDTVLTDLLRGQASAAGVTYGDEGSDGT
jgi:hypothetical protein